MLSYEEFKNTFCARFPEYMDGDYEDYELRLMPVVKKGRTLDGFTFCPKEHNESTRVMPTFYFDDIYESYMESEDIINELRRVSDTMKMSIEKGKTISENFDIRDFKNKIIAELIRPKSCESYIDAYPHRRFLDLFIVYRSVIRVDEDGVFSCLIDKGLAQSMGVTEEDLFRLAVRNTLKVIPPKTRSLHSIVRSSMRAEGKSEYYIKKHTASGGPENRILVLTNRHSYKAATYIIFDKYLSELFEKIGCGFFVVPTSVNEALIVPEDTGISPDQLTELLINSNSYFFDDGEQVLSDSIYYYGNDITGLEIVDAREVRV